jgi:hypothetical protein
MQTPRLVAIPLIAILAACASEPTITTPTATAQASRSLASAERAAVHQSAVVMWHAQQMLPAGTHNSGPVAGATAELVRNSNGISYRLSSPSLIPGHAYTLWLVVINNPAACTATPCSAANITQNAATRSQVRWAAGTVAGGSGHGSFAGAVQEGELSGWLPNRALEDSRKADVHLVVNDHGPMLPEFMPGMIQTYRGGCSNSSPFPPPFPASALADGEPGPNTCLLYQAAVFTAP